MYIALYRGTTVCVYKSMIQKLLHPCALFGQEAGSLFVFFGIFQIYRLMRGVEISGDDDLLAFLMKRVAQVE